MVNRLGEIGSGPVKISSDSEQQLKTALSQREGR